MLWNRIVTFAMKLSFALRSSYTFSALASRFGKQNGRHGMTICPEVHLLSNSGILPKWNGVSQSYRAEHNCGKSFLNECYLELTLPRTGAPSNVILATLSLHLFKLIALSQCSKMGGSNQCNVGNGRKMCKSISRIQYSEARYDYPQLGGGDALFGRG